LLAQIVELPDGVIRDAGMLWRPQPGASSSAEEFIAAQVLFMELHDDSGWNPWVLEDRADDLERAQAVMVTAMATWLRLTVTVTGALVTPRVSAGALPVGWS
jgi:hypothetical protein